MTRVNKSKRLMPIKIQQNFEYDKFGNVTKTTINDTPVEIKSYDEYGRVTKIKQDQ